MDITEKKSNSILQRGSSNKPKILALQGLRAVAFLAIFISHARIGSFGALGVWGVSVFFVLSGFVLVYNYWDKNITLTGFQFSKNKIKKLYPLHLAMTASCIVSAFIQGEAVMDILIPTIFHVSLTQVWLPYPKWYHALNGPSWYLCVCTFIYFCTPTIIKQLRKCKEVYKAIAWMIVLFCIQIAISFLAFCIGDPDIKAPMNVQWIVYYCPLSRLTDFLIGCLVGYLFINTRKSNRGHHFAIYVAEIVVSVMIILSWIIYWQEISVLGSIYIKYTVLFTPTTVILIWLILRGSGFMTRILSWKSLVAIGNLSPYTFLIHGVAIEYCQGILRRLAIVDNYLVAFLALSITFLSAVIWRKLEKIGRKLV